MLFHCLIQNRASHFWGDGIWKRYAWLLEHTKRHLNTTHPFLLFQELNLPPKAEMIKTAEEDMAEWTRRFKSDAFRVKGALNVWHRSQPNWINCTSCNSICNNNSLSFCEGLVDFQIYCDMLATRIGCNPPLRELFFRKPMIWLKIMFGPFTMHQYRWERKAAYECNVRMKNYFKTAISNWTVAFILGNSFV